MESLLKDEVKVFNSLPILVYILRPSKREVLYCNHEIKTGDKHNSRSFDDIIEMNDDLIKILDSDWDDPKKVVSKFTKSKDGRKLLLYIKFYKFDTILNETLLLITCADINNIKMHDFSKFYNPKHKIYGISTKEAGIDFLEGCIEGVKIEDTYFSVAYITVFIIEEMQRDDLGFEKEAHIKQLVTIIKNSIRATDMFAIITDTEFMMVFPKCKYEIMCNILTSIQNKLEIINNTNVRRNRFEFDYAVLEVSSKNIASSDKIIKRVRDMVV